MFSMCLSNIKKENWGSQLCEENGRNVFFKYQGYEYLKIAPGQLSVSTKNAGYHFAQLATQPFELGLKQAQEGREAWTQEQRGQVKANLPFYEREPRSFSTHATVTMKTQKPNLRQTSSAVVDDYGSTYKED